MAAQLALGALGVTLIYGILRFSNFRPWRHDGLRRHGDDPVHLGLQGWGVSLGPLPTALLALPVGDRR
jgi:branched-chain amino acid transport system permease protein